ncbi:MAG TPA: LamG domain-containing protein [Thermotogota bacterium]|nr:LamG domain-containing protein [Thermotogota bacterium]HQQ66879.1 LamG domain-containing protein [Thermotogota bacterium]
MQVMEKQNPAVVSMRNIPPVIAGLRDIRNKVILDADFSENAGNKVLDQSGYRQHGTITGASRSCDPFFTSLLKFDGIDDRVDFGTFQRFKNIAGSFSLCALYKRSIKDTVNADGIMGNWYWTSDGSLRRGAVLRYYINQNSVSVIVEVTNGSGIEERQVSTDAPKLNRWYFVVGSFNSSDRKVRLYLDGKLKGTNTASAGFDRPRLDGPTNFYVGYNPVNSGYFPGEVAWARVYEKALSDAQVRILFMWLKKKYRMV